MEPATGWRKIEGEILDGGGDGMGDDVEGDWDNPSPLACGEKQNIDGDSVGQPKRIENKVPPAGEADGVTNSWQAEPAWKGDGVFLGMVFPIEGDGAEKAEPF